MVRLSFHKIHPFHHFQPKNHKWNGEAFPHHYCHNDSFHFSTKSPQKTLLSWNGHTILDNLAFVFLFLRAQYRLKPYIRKSRRCHQTLFVLLQVLGNNEHHIFHLPCHIFLFRLGHKRRNNSCLEVFHFQHKTENNAGLSHFEPFPLRHQNLPLIDRHRCKGNHRSLCRGFQASNASYPIRIQCPLLVIASVRAIQRFYQTPLL